MGDIRQELELLKCEATRHRARRQEVGALLRWPEMFRRQTASLMVRGITAGALSSALGIERTLIRGWRNRYADTTKSTARFVELGIVPARARSASDALVSPTIKKLTLTGPRGATIHGLELHHVAALLQAELL